MIAIRQSLRQWRWYHWAAAVLILLYLTYIALSYLYLPGKLKDVVQNDLGRALGRTVKVERIAFNPFTLALTVDHFQIADRPQLPLVSWQRLFVNFDAWGSLFGWEARFSAVHLDSPHLAVERRKQGFNFSDILARLSKTPSPAPAARKRPLAVRIDDIQLREGRFRFDDISGPKPAHSAVRNVTVHVNDLYLATGDTQLNPFRLQAALPGGGSLRLDGRYRADPLLVKARIKASDIHLETFSQFLENQVPVKLSNGRLTLRTGVDISMEDTLQVQLQQGDVALSRLALDDATPTPPLLRCNSIHIQGIDMDLARRRFSIGQVTVDGFDTHQWLDADGRSRLQSLMPPQQAPPDQPAKAPAHTATPWAVSVAKTVVKNSRAAFTDRRNGLEATQKIHDLHATLGKILLNQGTPVPMTVNATVNDSGAFSADGHITLTPFAVDLNYRLHKLTLAPFNPYLQSLSWLQLKQGDLSLDGKVKVRPADHQPLDLTLNAGLDNLKAVDTRSGKTLLQWQALNVDQLQLNLAKRRLTINKVSLKAPDVAVERGPDKRLDVATLMKPGPSKTKAAAGTKAPAAPSAPWQVAVNQIGLRSASMHFTDASIRPVFKTGLYAVDFTLDRLTSAGKKPADFTLAAKVDRYAPFTVKGTLAPLQQQPGFAFTSRLQGFEMPALSPYTGTYIGNKLKSGQLGLDLEYRLKQHTLKGKNGIVAKQLYLGDEVKSDQAVNLPVGLGLALLRDASGVIDLDVGVSGNVDDPSFSVSGIIFKALKNIIVKAATSPFRLLASLVGGAEDLGAVEFPAGDSTLNADNRDKLRKLAKALTQRPQLVVTVKGCAGPAADDATLQMNRVLEKVAAQRKVPVSELQPATFLDAKANRKALRDLNDRLKLPGEGKRRETVSAAHPDLKGDALTHRVYQEMLNDVAARQTISQQDRLTLADQRALAIKQFLVATAGLDHSRLLMQKTTAEDLKGRVCDLGVQAH